MDYIISRRDDDDRYTLWRFSPDGDELLTPVALDPDARLDHSHRLASIGSYLLEWGPLSLEHYYPCFPYRLLRFDPDSRDPLGTAPVQQGAWPKHKFWGSRVDFGNPEGGHEQYDEGRDLLLVPLHNFMLNFIPTAGRGTFRLWNFDPGPEGTADADPLPSPWTPQGAFETIEYGHVLLPVGNHVLDYVPDDGSYRIWSFDPQNHMVLARPVIASGRWESIDAGHRLVAIGDLVLDWVPADGSYRLWRFDATADDPLTGPVRTGHLPEALAGDDTTLTGIQAPRPVRPEWRDRPGTIDFMRSRIRHVVYYMIENRSFDHVCGWLYEHGGEDIHFVGPDHPFRGVGYDDYNVDDKGRRVHVSKYRDGRLSEDWLLECLDQDPYHDCSDVMRQCFHGDPDGYARRATPDMSGFIHNNGTDQIMQTYSPEQLPVLNGLARAFAVSDEWFCSMPGGTDVNRAFSLTGSALQQLNNLNP